MNPEAFEKLLYIFSADHIIRIVDFIDNVGYTVRGEFYPIFVSYVYSFGDIAVSISELFKNTNIVAISFGIASSIWIAKKAFKWFRQMCR